MEGRNLQVDKIDLQTFDVPSRLGEIILEPRNGGRCRNFMSTALCRIGTIRYGNFGMSHSALPRISGADLNTAGLLKSRRSGLPIILRYGILFTGQHISE
jgi:hypothetical protein